MNGNDISHTDRSTVYLFEPHKNRFLTSPIRILGKAPEGWSAPDIVEIEIDNKTVIGFLKSRTSAIECNLEIVLYQIGALLGVPIATTVVAFSDSEYRNQSGIISISVENDSSEKFTSFRTMRDELYLDLCAGTITKTPWIERWMKIRERKEGLPSWMWDVEAIDRQEYYDCLQFAVEISKLYTEKHDLRIDGFIASYVKMLSFDILFGQSDRSPSNYGCVVNQNEKSGFFSPLFDNSTLSKPYINNDFMSLNQVILDRRTVAEVSSSIFGETFSDCCATILEQKDAIFSTISMNGLISKQQRELLQNRVDGGLRIIEDIAKHFL